MPISRTALGDDRKVSTAVVEAVAEAEGVTPTEIDTPLHRAIDPEALNRLFGPERASTDAGPHVTFTYTDYEITVLGPERIVVRPAEEGERVARDDSPTARKEN
jgi:hypothetical protein